MSISTQHEPQRRTPVTLRLPKGVPAILIVEDDANIRRFICSLLRSATTAFVAEAADPYTALSIAREISCPIDLLISDINLCAGMNGIALARELALTNPSLKVLLISGADVPQFEIPVQWRFLAKPFPIETFLDCVRALCRSVSAPAAYFG